MISDINICVDRDKCTACGLCVDRCPLDNLRLFMAPCRSACPLKMNCQGYIRLIAQNREPEAVEEMRRFLPFGGIVGRICSHPCEAACERTKLGEEAVHIRALKRYLADQHPQIAAKVPPVAEASGHKVAIVGSGPAGLMAAYDLQLQGHQVTVFEADDEPGGLLRWAIPSFRLPVAEITAAVKMLTEMGITLRTGQALGRDIALETLEQEYQAVLLAVGAGASAHLKIPGETLEGVHQGLSFLKRAKQNRVPLIGDSVVVIGGGNTALDVALTCRKIGAADVRIVCLEAGEQMPAYAPELREAQEEGVIIENCWGARRFEKTATGKLAIEVSQCLRVFDADGAFCPELEDACALGFEADTIIIAAGQQMDTGMMPAELLDEAGLLAVDPATLQIQAHEKVFACGDAVTGATSAVDAMAHGREAALSIHRFVTGQGLRWGRDDLTADGFLSAYEAEHARAAGGARMPLKRLAVAQRTLLAEIEAPLKPAEAAEQAKRCLSCGRAAEVNKSCWYCLPCEIECPTQALEVKLPYLIR